jgi:hypothetical protein
MAPLEVADSLDGAMLGAPSDEIDLSPLWASARRSHPGIMFLLCLLRIVWEETDGLSPLEERNVKAYPSLNSKLKADASDDFARSTTRRQ